MPEAVIVDAIRTPIGRAMKGSLKSVRADDLAAIPLKALIERNPEVELRRDRRCADGRRLGDRRAGLQRRAQRDAAGRHRPPRRRLHGQSLLRLVADDDPDGLACDQGRRGRPVHRCRRRGRLASRARRGHDGGGQAPDAQRGRQLPVRRLHPDGADGRERCRALPRHPRAAGRVGRDLAEPRRGGARQRPLRRRDRARHGPRPQGSSTGRATRSTCPRPSSTRTTDRARGRRWTCSRSSSPRSRRTGPSRPATRARSTTAPRRCWSCRTRRPGRSG